MTGPPGLSRSRALWSPILIAFPPMRTRSLLSAILFLFLAAGVAVFLASDPTAPPVAVPPADAEQPAPHPPAKVAVRAGATEMAGPKREAVGGMPRGIAARSADAVTKPAGIHVRGRVVDDGGRGLADAEVSQRPSRADDDPGLIERIVRDALPTARDGKVVSDADGFFELSLPGPGAFEIAATHAAHPPTRAGVMGESGRSIDGVLLTMQPGVAIAGRITGVPEGITVTVVAGVQPSPQPATALLHAVGALDSMRSLRADRRAPAAADGTFALRGLAVDGDYRVWAVQGEWSRARAPHAATRPRYARRHRA